MKNWTILWAVLLALGLILMGCPGIDDDDSAGDDDSAIGDDDTEEPDYVGPIDMGSQYTVMYAECTVDVYWDFGPDGVPGGGDDTYGEGSFYFEIDVDGVADYCWIELMDEWWYEGYYGPDLWAGAGDYYADGWDMDWDDFGWDSTLPDGHQHWSLHSRELAYYNDFSGHAADESVFICENMGNNVYTFFCCCDSVDTEFCECTEFPQSSW